MKIKIKIPKTEKDKWRLGLGFRPRSMATATTLINRLERLLPRLILKEKIAIKVLEYEDGSWKNSNESYASQDTNYLIYATSCFLEDYLSFEVKKRVEKQYLK